MFRRFPVVIWAVLFVSLLARPESTHSQQAAPTTTTTATMRVIVPHVDTQLVIQGAVTQQKGTSRIFVSPALESGKKYIYTLVGTWRPNNYTTIIRTRQVEVAAGQEVEVDLRKPDAKFPDDILVRYVPTPDEVVQAMLKLGEVGKDDVVFDLGCGDGRIVITGVEKFGAKRGVGVDIDPERIKDSVANAKKAKVEDRVEFRQQDVLKLKDISDATVVMLYMGEDLNLALRPILKSSLKPGSRIVSHRFRMGDWKPDQTITVSDKSGQEYFLHLWKIGEKSEEKKE